MKTACGIIVLLLMYHLSLAQCNDTLPASFPLGANLNGLSDWNLDRPFNDEFITNRGISANLDAPWNYQIPQTDPTGWPIQDFSVIVMVNMRNNQPATYKILFNGQATISPIASSFTVQNKQYDAASNITTADLVYTSNPDQMMIKFTNTQYALGIKGVKNIRILKPGLATNAPTFSKQFLDHLARFQALRFMNWTHANANEDSLWSDRTLKAAPSQTDPDHVNHGIAWEYCIELANTLKKDIWINIPHKANNDYVIQLANLLKNTLDPSLKIYIEYSNEVWNWSFSQAQWNLNKAIEEANAGDPINFDNVNDKYTWHYRRIARRGKEISDIFRSVYSNQPIGNQLRPVYAVQVAYFDVGQRGIEFIHDYYGSPGQFFYGLAGAPYFNSAAIDTSNTASSSQVLDALRVSMQSQFTGPGNSINQYAATSTYYGLRFICYEGGPDTFGPNNVLAKQKASEDTAAKTLCVDYLKKWYGYGPSGLFMWFTAGASDWTTAYGTWSLTENYENSQKLIGIDSILHLPVTAATVGMIIPGKIDARKYEGYPTNWNQIADFTSSWQPYDQYLLNVPSGKAGDYNFTVETSCGSTGNSFKVSVDNVLLDSLAIPNNANNGYVINTLGSLFLKEGIHTLRFAKSATGNNYHIGNYTAILDKACVPVATNPNEGDIIIFPVPASNTITVKINGFTFPVTLNIYNIAGALLYAGNLFSGTKVMDISRLDKGVYIVKVGSVVKKFIKF